MSTVISISTRRRYGVARVRRAWGVARAGVYRRRGTAETPPAPRRRPGPQGRMSDAALVEAIRQALVDSPFHGEGYRKVWAQLRHIGLRTSKERVRRLMRENALQAATRVGRPRGPRNHDGTIILEAVDAMWGTDMTATFTVEHGQVAVFVAVDHYLAEGVGIHAALHGARHEALEPIRQGVAERFGAVEKEAAAGLGIRHDHGSLYMSRDFQREIAWLGAASSPAFVRAPEGNGCAERFIRTLKENLLWVRTFRTVEELRLALIDFRQTYNECWLIERHGHRSPAQFRRDQMDKIPTGRIRNRVSQDPGAVQPTGAAPSVPAGISGRAPAFRAGRIPSAPRPRASRPSAPPSQRWRSVTDGRGAASPSRPATSFAFTPQ